MPITVTIDIQDGKVFGDLQANNVSFEETTLLYNTLGKLLLEISEKTLKDQGYKIMKGTF